MNPRVLHVVQELRRGGAETIVRALMLDAPGATAVAAAPGPWSADFPRPHYDLPLIERRPARVPGAALSVRRAIADFRPDLLHVHNPGVAAAAGLATLRGRRPRGLVSFHGLPDRDYAATVRVLRACGFPVVACGTGVAEALREAGLPPWTTVQNGVPPPPPPPDRAALRQALGVPVDAFLISVVARLAPVKNPHLGLEVAAALPQVHVAMVGDGPLRGSLEADAAGRGIADRVRFTGTRDDARSVMAASDCVLLCSDAEGLPLVGLEAMTSGTPLVATATRWTSHLVTDGGDVLLAAPGSAPSIISAVRRLLDDPDLGPRLAAAAHTTVEPYTERAMISRFHELYDQVLTGTAPGPGGVTRVRGAGRQAASRA